MNNKISYIEKLKNPKWQKKRLEIFVRDGWACIQCGNTNETLHVHHIIYTVGKEPWEYDNTNFQTLCEKCHSEKHEIPSPGVIDSELKKERDKTISECLLLITTELQIKLNELFNLNTESNELIDFIRQYDNEKVNCLLLEYFSLEEITLNSLLTAARFAAYANLKGYYGENYSQQDYNKHINEYIAKHPFEDHILKALSPQFELLVLRALQTISNKIYDESQFLSENEMNKNMQNLIKLKRVQMALDADFKEKSKERLRITYQKM